MNAFLKPGIVPTEKLSTISQEALALVAELTSVEGIEDLSGVIISEDTPSDSSDFDKLWLKKSAEGVALGLFYYLGGWQEVHLRPQSGSTGSRPVDPPETIRYFDTEIHTALVYERGKWRTVSGSVGDVKFVQTDTLQDALDNNPGWVELIAMRSRCPVGAGTGSGLSKRDVKASFGAESHALVAAEMEHFHGVGSTFQQDNDFTLIRRTWAAAAGAAYQEVTGDGVTSGVIGTTGIPGQTGPATSDISNPSAQPHSSIQPSFALWCLVKE